MNYCDDPAMVRVDFFKESGKWYTTEAVRWVGCSDDLYKEFAESLRQHFKDTPNRLSGMDAICLNPCTKHGYPIQLKQGSWNKNEDY